MKRHLALIAACAAMLLFSCSGGGGGDSSTSRKILVGGYNFDTYNGDAIPNALIRLNADGSLDTTFNNGGSGFDDRLLSIKTLANGKILAGGNFTTYNGDTVPFNLIRLNSDGSWDDTFNSGGTGFDDFVLALEVQSDGKILVGGMFTSYNGAPVPNGILRLNEDGSLDTTFNNAGDGVDNYVQVIKVLSDGGILAGGQFTAYNSVAVPKHLFKLDSTGAFDTSFNTGGAGFDNAIASIAELKNGKILAGGLFANYNGADVPDGIIMLDADGAHNTSFNNGGAGVTAAKNVRRISVLVNGKVLIIGTFSTYNGADIQDGLLRLNSDGTCDTSFNNGGSGVSAAGNPWELIVLSGGDILIGSKFTTYNGVDTPDSIIRLNGDGTWDQAFNKDGPGLQSSTALNILALELE
jgi:uncharacterized delta-60 repeat protein